MNKIDFKNYDLIIFDMDGTLYFQRPLQIHMAFLLLANMLRHPLDGFFVIRTLQVFRHCRNQMKGLAVSDSYRYSLTQAAQQLHRSESEINTIIQKWMFTIPLQIINKYQDHNLIRNIKLLQSQNKKIAIYSDYPAEQKSRAIGLSDIPCHDAADPLIDCMKPNPKGIRHIMQLYDICDPKKVLMVGDRKSLDGMAAKAAGTDYMILPKSYLRRNYLD